MKRDLELTIKLIVFVYRRASPVLGEISLLTRQGSCLVELDVSHINVACKNQVDFG